MDLLSEIIAVFVIFLRSLAAEGDVHLVAIG